MMAFAALSLGSQMLVAVAQGAPQSVPTFDVTPSCRTAALALNTGGRDMQGCLNSENAARKSIVEQWSQFQPADRAMCSALSMTGSSPTYTELLTCLEMARDGRAIGRTDPQIRGLAEGTRTGRAVTR